MTTAHNVAGSDAVTVDVDGQTLDASVVSYDPDADIAILAVPNLRSPPLLFASAREEPSSGSVVALGYPADEAQYTATPARIAGIISLNGPNIYRQGSINREVYIVRAMIRLGQTGGPLIDPNGQVVGVVLATDKDNIQIAYVLTATEVSRQMTRIANTETVDTGECF